MWYLGIFIFFYIPGNLILRWADFQNDEFFVSLFHAVALGTALMPLIYLNLRRISHPELIYVIGAMLFSAWLIFLLKDMRRGVFHVHTSYHALFSITILISVVLLLLHFSHFTDIVFLEHGFTMRTHPLTENVFYLGIVNTLKDTFPPPYPYASNTISFSFYHLGMCLAIEMFHRLFSIDTLTLTYFYIPLLYFCLLAVIAYLFVFNCSKSMFLGVVAGILMFCSDFSYIPGLLGLIPEGYPWTAFFMPNIWAIFTLNGNLPALFILILCIVYLRKYYHEDKLPYLLLFAVLGFSAFEFKSTMGLHIIGATFLAGIVSIVFRKDHKKGTALSAVSFLLMVIMIVNIVWLREGVGNFILKPDFLNFFKGSLGKLGFTDISWNSVLIILPVYLLIVLGTRGLIFYFLKKDFRKNDDFILIIFLSVFILAGFAFAEFFFLGDSTMALNHLIWFSVQSLTGASLLLALFLVRLREHDMRSYILFSLIIIVVSFPSTVQFLKIRFSPTYYPVGAEEIEVVDYLETTKPDSVILHLPNNDGPSLASNLAGRSSVLSFLQSYVVLNIGEEEANKRLKAVKDFFNFEKTIDRSSILKQYAVNYVYAPASFEPYLNKEPVLVQVLKNKAYVVYKVVIYPDTAIRGGIASEAKQSRIFGEIATHLSGARNDVDNVRLRFLSLDLR